jgi:PAS domain S-box-containing protein
MQVNKYTNTTKRYKKKLLQNSLDNTQIPDSALNNNITCFQQAFIHSPVVWLLVDPITGDIVDTNAAASKFYGYSIAELRSKKIFEISVSSVKKIEASMFCISNNVQRPIVCQHKLKNGQIRDVNIYSGSFKSGDKLVISLMVIDITAKRKAKEKLKQSQQRLALALDGTNVGIWDLDVGNKMIFCDKRYLAMLGYEAQGIGNHQVSWQEFCHPDDIVHVKEAVQNYLAGRVDRFEDECRWKHKDGTYRWIFSTGKVVYGNKNHPIRLVGLSFDITDKKRLQTTYEIRRRSIVLNNILNGIRCLDQDYRVYAKSLGLDFAQPLLCCVINIEIAVTDKFNHGNDDISRETMNHKIITELSNTAGCVLWECRSKIGVLYQVKQDNNKNHSTGSSLARSLQKKINSYYPDIIATIGIGETQQEPSGFKKSFQQAWEAVSIAQGSSNGKDIVHFLDLGILQLLVKQANKSYVPEFIERTIGKLIHYDNEKRTDYLDTLEAILQNSNLKVTANLLFLHYNTIVFRKKRIEKILETSISEFEMKLTLATAIKLYKLNLQNQNFHIK